MLPDLTGYKLDKALEVLDSLGVEGIKIVVTTPPRERLQQPSENARVLRVNEMGTGELEILVCI